MLHSCRLLEVTETISAMSVVRMSRRTNTRISFRGVKGGCIIETYLVGAGVFLIGRYQSLNDFCGRSSNLTDPVHNFSPGSVH